MSRHYDIRIELKDIDEYTPEQSSRDAYKILDILNIIAKMVGVEQFYDEVPGIYKAHIVTEVSNE